jgi:hypothetical protein
MQEIKHLVPLHDLESVFLRGNGFSKRSANLSYKEYLVHHVPQVVNIDGKAVAEENRRLATKKIVNIEGLLDEERNKWSSEKSTNANERAVLSTENKRLVEEVEAKDRLLSSKSRNYDDMMLKLKEYEDLIDEMRAGGDALPVPPLPIHTHTHTNTSSVLHASNASINGGVGGGSLTGLDSYADISKISDAMFEDPPPSPPAATKGGSRFFDNWKDPREMSLKELEEAIKLLRLHIAQHGHVLQTWDTEYSNTKRNVMELKDSQKSMQDEISWTSREVEAVTYELGGDAGVPTMDVGKEVELEAAKRKVMDLYRLRDRLEDTDSTIDKALQDIDAQIKDKTISFSNSFAQGDFDTEIFALMNKLEKEENEKSFNSQQRIQCQRDISRLEAKLLSGHKEIALVKDDDTNRRFQLRKMLSDWETRSLLNGQDDAEDSAGMFNDVVSKSLRPRRHVDEETVSYYRRLRMRLRQFEERKRKIEEDVHGLSRSQKDLDEKITDGKNEKEKLVTKLHTLQQEVLSKSKAGTPAGPDDGFNSSILSNDSGGGGLTFADLGISDGTESDLKGPHHEDGLEGDAEMNTTSADAVLSTLLGEGRGAYVQTPDEALILEAEKQQWEQAQSSWPTSVAASNGVADSSTVTPHKTDRNGGGEHHLPAETPSMKSPRASDSISELKAKYQDMLEHGRRDERTGFDVDERGRSVFTFCLLFFVFDFLFFLSFPLFSVSVPCLLPTSNIVTLTAATPTARNPPLHHHASRSTTAAMNHILHYHIDRHHHHTYRPSTHHPRSAAKLMVTVMKARSLPVTKKIKRTADGYAVLTLAEREEEEGDNATESVGGYKTEVVRDNLFPIWDQDFLFKEVQSKDAVLNITLMNAAPKSIGVDEVIGVASVRLGDLQVGSVNRIVIYK